MTILAFVNGFSELILVGLGIFYFIRYIIYFITNKKKMQLFIAFLALSLGCMHLGGATAFIMKLIWEQDLDIIVYGFLSYIHFPIGLTLAIYLGYDLFNPELKLWMVVIHALLGVAYLIAMIGWPRIMIYSPTVPTPDEVIDININHVALGITIVYLISAVLVLGGNLLRLQRKMDDSERELRKKSILLGIGWILFGFAGLLCTFNPLNITIVPNSICFAAFVLIFTGFLPIKAETQNEA